MVLTVPIFTKLTFAPQHFYGTCIEFHEKTVDVVADVRSQTDARADGCSLHIRRSLFTS